MNLDEYQHATARTDRAAPFFEAVANHAMGLAGESGELVDALKKLLFHGHEVDADAIRKELGDVLWYVARIADDFGLTLSEVAQANIAKLRARYPDGFREADSIARRDAHSPPAAAGSHPVEIVAQRGALVAASMDTQCPKREGGRHEWYVESGAPAFPWTCRRCGAKSMGGA